MPHLERDRTWRQRGASSKNPFFTTRPYCSKFVGDSVTNTSLLLDSGCVLLKAEGHAQLCISNLSIATSRSKLVATRLPSLCGELLWGTNVSFLHDDKEHARCGRVRGIRREPTACRRRVGTWMHGLQEGCRRHGSSVGDARRAQANLAAAERHVETNRTQEGCPLATEVGRFDTSDQRLATAPDRLQSTDIAQPGNLEQVPDLGVAQDGLAQLKPELGAK
mmetsp:Transcript_124546/g.398399  ORF Transcript_124546/g.398399 Transcript_124546/m.398399 type:complete len:221 (+) Transcript_124546:752-1414(+)